jgi:hypothetical protein
MCSCRCETSATWPWWWPLQPPCCTKVSSYEVRRSRTLTMRPSCCRQRIDEWSWRRYGGPSRRRLNETAWKVEVTADASVLHSLLMRWGRQHTMRSRRHACAQSRPRVTVRSDGAPALRRAYGERSQARARSRGSAGDRGCEEEE